MTETNTIPHSRVASTDRPNPVLPFYVLGYTGQNDKTKWLKFGTEMFLFSDVAEWVHPTFKDLKSPCHKSGT